MSRKSKAPIKQQQPDPNNFAPKHLPKALRDATPRLHYLFKAWDAASGGNDVLDTPEAIIPAAFLEGQGPASLNELAMDELKVLWHRHLNLNQHQHVKTVFSSWTHSLNTVLAEAGQREEAGHSAVHVSVIDTHKLDSDRNKVLHTADPGIRALGLESVEGVYLAFGIISGAAHTAVSAADIITIGKLPLSRFGFNHLPILAAIDKHLVAARRAACLFGKDFELVLTCYLLTKRWQRGRPDEEAPEDRAYAIEQLCAGYDVPAEWKDEEDIVYAVHIMPAHKEPMQASQLMRELAEYQHRLAEMRDERGSAEIEVEAEIEGETGTEVEAETKSATATELNM